MSSKLTIETPERCQLTPFCCLYLQLLLLSVYLSIVYAVNLEQVISYCVTLNIDAVSNISDMNVDTPFN